jgi:CheY-like chemotaxis protein
MRARIQTDFGEVAPVLASEGQLSQVFLNLIVNAAHAIREGNVEGNRISIRSWQEGDQVCAEVSDSGSGIAPHHLQHIFEPFFTTKPVGVGSGLGLPIVKSILTRYSGTIEVHSQLGKGSTFIVRLPAALPEHLSLHPRSSGGDQIIGSRARIMIIDDDMLVRDVLAKILKEHEIVTASSGEEALRVLGQDQVFDLILCDVMMPRTSGIDVHRWLVETHPELARKVVFVTGGAFTSGAREYLAQIDNPRLEKPFNAVFLEKKVLEWVAAGKRDPG